jgi:acetate CoA/acetoacetate CoA-transferase alpha subunit
MIHLEDAVARIPNGASLTIGGFMALWYAGTSDRRACPPAEAPPDGPRERYGNAGKGYRQADRPRLVNRVVASHIGLNPENKQHQIQSFPARLHVI